MHDCLISFGSNEGDSAQIYLQAVARIADIAAVKLLASSKPLRTAPVGGPDGQPSYLNAAIRVETELDAQDFHLQLTKVENDLGRSRRERWGSRKIDLDLLIHGRFELDTDSLTLPHPRMSFRRFVLQPANEIASDMVHTTSGQTVGQLLTALDQREDLVLFVLGAQDMESADRSNHQDLVRRWLPSGWRLEIILNPKQLAEREGLAKLVCFVDQRCHSRLDSRSPLIEAAVRFPGPTLRLCEDREQSETEIKAAFKAIEPLTDVQKSP